MSMARKVDVVRPRAERESSITARQHMVRVPITDLNAEIRRRRWEKTKRLLLRVALVAVATIIAVGLVLLCGKGARH